MSSRPSPHPQPPAGDRENAKRRAKSTAVTGLQSHQGLLAAATLDRTSRPSRGAICTAGGASAKALCLSYRGRRFFSSAAALHTHILPGPLSLMMGFSLLTFPSAVAWQSAWIYLWNCLPRFSRDGSLLWLTSAHIAFVRIRLTRRAKQLFHTFVLSCLLLGCAWHGS